jgi:hypothetical protein
MDTEQGQRAFTVRRRVAFGDTDVAGSVFLSNVTRYCMEAIEGGSSIASAQIGIASPWTRI